MIAKQDLDAASLEREFTNYALEQAHPLVRAWRGDQLKTDVYEATKGLVALIADDDTARNYADSMKVLAQPPEQFKMRLVEIGGHRFLAQIDFADPSASLPHVPIEAPGTHIDQHFLAGLAREMAARPSAPALARVTLQHPADLAFYPRYVETYEQMFLARPQMRGEVRVESQQTLAVCHAEGLL